MAVITRLGTLFVAARHKGLRKVRSVFLTHLLFARSMTARKIAFMRV